MGIDKELISAYVHTRYEVWAPYFCIRPGACHPKVDAWLQEAQLNSWAFVTAWNPGSVQLPEPENRRRQAGLEKKVQESGWPYYPGAGVPEKGDWHPEESFLIAGISLPDAITLGKELGQNAILWGQNGQAAQIIYLH